MKISINAAFLCAGALITPTVAQRLRGVQPITSEKHNWKNNRALSSGETCDFGDSCTYDLYNDENNYCTWSRNEDYRVKCCANDNVYRTAIYPNDRKLETVEVDEDDRKLGDTCDMGDRCTYDVHDDEKNYCAWSKNENFDVKCCANSNTYRSDQIFWNGDRKLDAIEIEQGERSLGTTCDMGDRCTYDVHNDENNYCTWSKNEDFDVKCCADQKVYRSDRIFWNGDRKLEAVEVVDAKEDVEDDVVDQGERNLGTTCDMGDRCTYDVHDDENNYCTWSKNEDFAVKCCADRNVYRSDRIFPN